MNRELLTQIAKQMVTKGKGIIAADESAKTCNTRFEAVGLPSTEETRRAFREMLFTTPELEQYVSGIIFYDETFHQRTNSGLPFPEYLVSKGILPGIKVDAGTIDMPLHPGEKVTEGLDGLGPRLTEYFAQGARFAKWRAVITISDTTPTHANLVANAHALARYAALCQQTNIVPMIEPEVLIDGNHTLEQSYDVTHTVLAEVFAQLKEQDVFLPGVILKSSMVIAGKDASTQSTPQEVAQATVRCLKDTVPSEIPGIVFLSGGQGDEQATANLNEMNKLADLPWPLTFSYSRAIQRPALTIYAKDPSTQVEAAQKALLFRVKMNSLASKGEYKEEMESGRGY